LSIQGDIAEQFGIPYIYQWNCCENVKTSLIPDMRLLAEISWVIQSEFSYIIIEIQNLFMTKKPAIPIPSLLKE